MLRGDRVAGRFEILGEAGRGGMGTVFRAHDRRARRDVALKVLTAQAVDNLARFEREAALLAAVRHPGIVEYVSHGATPDGLHYLVMEWVEGQSLAERLAQDGVDPNEAVVVAMQVARALGALHAAGIAHRDVKPANLMLVGRTVDAVKLVDLGVARRADDAVKLTVSGAMVGTVGYMAPEQVRGARAEVDGRADLFALGCVLYQCLSGAPPFGADTALAGRAMVLLHDPPPLRQVAPWVPAPLEALVARLLQRRSVDRPADAGEVERSLAALGPLPARPAVPATLTQAVSDSVTVVGFTAAPRCVVLVALADATSDERAVIDELVGAAPFDAGVVMAVTAPLATAAGLAARLADRLPRAVIAVAPGERTAEVIDRCGRLIAAVTLAGAAGGPAAPGAWIDAAHAAALEPGAAMMDGAHLRLRRGAA